MEKKKLIFFDLDDTLLRRDKSLSDKSLRVLKLLQDNGHKIVIDTARNKVSTMPIIELIKPDYTIINAGGYIINEKQEMIRNLLIDSSTCKKVVDEVKDKARIISIQTDDVLYTSDNKDKSPLRTLIDLDGFNGMDCYKVLVYDIEQEYGKKLARKYNLDFENYFGGSWSRFCHIDATKAKALEFITSYEGADLSDTIAFGDDYGDIKMIETSGIGVAMANALDDVKKCTKYHCKDCDDDGVARFLDDFFKLGIYE